MAVKRFCVSGVHIALNIIRNQLGVCAVSITIKRDQ